MMPGNPAEKDYDDPIYDPFWEAAVALELPLSFHILTSSGDNSLAKPRGPKINGFLAIIRGCQDIMGMLVFGGVFERHPGAARRLRRGRCRLGAAFHVPHGPRLQASPLLDEGQGARPPAVGIFPRSHLAHLPGRLDGLPVRRPAGPAPADVGQRLPAQQFDLAVEPGRDRRADRPSRSRAAEAHPARQRRRALQAAASRERHSAARRSLMRARSGAQRRQCASACSCTARSAGGPSSRPAWRAAIPCSTSACWTRSPSMSASPTTPAISASAIPSITCRSRASRSPTIRG